MGVSVEHLVHYSVSVVDVTVRWVVVVLVVVVIVFLVVTW